MPHGDRAWPDLVSPGSRARSSQPRERTGRMRACGLLVCARCPLSESHDKRRQIVWRLVAPLVEFAVGHLSARTDPDSRPSLSRQRGHMITNGLTRLLHRRDDPPVVLPRGIDGGQPESPDRGDETELRSDHPECDRIGVEADAQVISRRGTNR